ncbi:MAG: hypothetical protein AB7U85_05800 [Alphaproteobacteria bacterium]
MAENIKTISLNTEADYKKVIESLTSKKYRIKKKNDASVLLKKRAFGSFFEHCLILIITFGLFNIFWAYWCNSKADKVMVVLDKNNPASTEDEIAEITAKKTKQDDLLWKVFLVAMAFVVVLIYFGAYASVSSKRAAVKAKAASMIEQGKSGGENSLLVLPDENAEPMVNEAEPETEVPMQVEINRDNTEEFSEESNDTEGFEPSEFMP